VTRPAVLDQLDAPARDRIRTSLDESLLVEAAAGTGKTTELVRRIVAVIADGRMSPERGGKGMSGLVAVTFTRKAAGELELRLRQELEDARQCAIAGGDAAARQNVEEAIRHLEEAHIGTIHSFCAELLRERPVEARIDPAFEFVSEEEGPRLFAQAFNGWIQETLQEMPEGVRRALVRLASKPPFGGLAPLDRLMKAGLDLAEWRDFRAPWRRPQVDLHAHIDSLVESVEDLADLARRCRDPRDGLRVAIDPAEVLAGWVERVEAVAPRDYDELEARLVDLAPALRRRWLKGRGKFADGISRAEVIEKRDALLQRLEQFRDLADADLAGLLRQELQGLLDRYDEIKRRHGQLDFVDLMVRTRELLRRDREVRRFFQERFTHIFVDEFQDTDPLQTEILLLLAADDAGEVDWRRARPVPGKLFLVGDPKQSIYRFRRADVVLYQEVKRGLEQRGVGSVQLEQSFRATLPIQAAINQAFAAQMVEDGERGQPGYIHLLPARRHDAQQPAVVVLPVSHPYGIYQVSRMQIDESLPRDLVAFVDWLLRSSGWTVEDVWSGERRAIVPDDVCVLFRRYLSWNRDVTRPYTRGLEARGIPHVLVGARTFHQREEVETLRAALTAVEWPDDPLAVFATLRGSLFSIDDEMLLRFHRGRKFRLHPFSTGKELATADEREYFAPMWSALELLADLHRRRNRRPVVETLQELLEATRAWAALALRPAGNQVLLNAQRVCDLARSYELGGGISFRGFVERLNEEAAQPSSTQAPVVEEGAAGVRLMTVHAAKGLEFPVVILADMTATLARNDPDKHVDAERGLAALRLLGCAPEDLVDNADLEHERDEAEGVRIAYVAATRARDLLVVPAVGDAPLDGWLKPLDRAIFPERKDRRASLPAPGCPPFGDSSVIPRAQDRPDLPVTSVRPGLHRLGAPGHEVVWWDPLVLGPPAVENFGLRQQEVLAEQAGADEAGRSRYEEWRRRRAETLEAGKRKTREVVVVTELEEGPYGAQPRITFATTERAPGRPSGVRFGTLVHTLLRDTALDAATAEIARLAQLHATILGAPAEESVAAVLAVERALRHSVFERARAAAARGAAFREPPFVVALDDGRLLEGTIDLAFEENGRWIVVDFKTDADVGSRRERYEIQLAWYLFALERVKGGLVEGVLLAV
jgi:ATP-dependent exoDNAse (exonuclease V) beta subunit